MAVQEDLPLYLVDAFAERPFQGNPAAVCLVDSWPDQAWLQSVAAEMKQSETAFIRPAGEQFELRWLTPAVEVDLCGHATLASAFVLWHTSRVQPGDPIRFSTRSGMLIARQRDGFIELDFPSDPPREASPPPGLLESLGVRAQYTGQGRFDYLIEVETEDQLRRMSPDFKRLSAAECRGVIVTARGSGEFDFVSRFFAPAAGVDEDPVTGSAHCTLACYWQTRLGKQQFRAYQASPRGGVLGIAIEGDRVSLRGRAVLVFEGRLNAGMV
jgi:predicted PhzF superfamily epimerase YddE/YHI9